MTSAGDGLEPTTRSIDVTFYPVSNHYSPRFSTDQWPDLSYVVRPNEDLNDIANRYRIGVQSLLDANPAVGHARDVRAGQQITIPARPDVSEQPVVDVHDVTPSQSMLEVASQHGIPLALLVSANPQIANPRLLYSGDQLLIPVAQQNPSGPDVSAAVHELQVAEADLQRTRDLAAQGDRAASAELQRGGLETRVHNAKAQLQSAVAGEIERRSGGQPSLATVDTIGGEIASVYAGSPLAEGAVRQAVAAYREDRQIDFVHDDISAAGDMQAQLRELNQQYAALPASLQTKLLADPRTRSLFDSAARHANEPLSNVSSDPANPDIEPHTNLAITRLETLTKEFDPSIAAGIVASALPAYESIQQRAEGYPVLGFNGTQVAVRLADNVWRASNGSSLVSRLVDVGSGNINSIAVPLYEGTGPAYLLELGRHGASLPGDMTMFEYALSGVEQYANGQLTEPAQAYFEHLEELQYLVQNGGSAMSPQQLDAAVRAYMTEKGPEWESRLNELRTQLKDSGTALLDQIQQLQEGLDQVPADQRGALQERITALLGSPEAQLVVTVALNDNPQLVRGARGTELAATFVELGIVGHDQPLAVTFVAAYLRENVLGPSANIDLSDPASLGLMRSQLEQALRDNGALASMLQVNPQQMNEIADALLSLVPASGSPVDAFEHANSAARNANNALDKLDTNLGRNTPFNLAFRTSAVAIVGSGLVGAIERYGDDPRLRNAVDVVLESARVGVDGAQLFATMRSWPQGPGVSTLQMAAKFVHVLGATMAGADGLNRLGQGDYFGAGLSLAVAGGVAWGALGSSAMAGPIGFGVAAIATVGLWIYDGIRSASHNSRFEGEATAHFLERADFDPDAARELADQSGDGYSVVPLLMRYGELHGMTAQQTVKWINDIDPTRLGALRDSLHRTLDELDGDVSRFQATDARDALQVHDTQQRPWFAASGAARPMSAAQVDAILTVLEIRQP